MASSKNYLHLQFFYQNVRGLRTKTNTFYNNISASSYDILLITESWLCDGILDSELSGDEYDVFRRDRGSLGGGVMTLCASQLCACVRSEWERPDTECLWVTVPARALGTKYNLHIANVYLPPDCDIQARTQQLVEVVGLVVDKHPNDYLMVAGDFNLPCIDWSTGDPVFLRKGSVALQNSALFLINELSLLGLTQYNYLKNSHDNTLDLIFSNFSMELTKADLPAVKEDAYHPAVSINATDILIPEFKPMKRRKYQFQKADYTSLNDHFLNVDWSFIGFMTETEEVVDKFYSLLNEAVDCHVPTTIITNSNKYPKWYSKALINLIREKSRIHKHWKRYRNPMDYFEFSVLRSRQKELQDKCYKEFIIHSQENIKMQPKLFWKYVKAKRGGNGNYPKLMTYENDTLDNEKDICNAFNKFFLKNFSSPSTSYSSANIIESQNEIVQNIQVDKDYISKLLKNLDLNKGPGSDGLPPILFVSCMKSLAMPIALIFNRCISCGYFPKIWKTAHIVPVHKKGLKTAIPNYRPISILNVLSKLFEKVVHQHIYSTISRSIPPQQHGFLKGRSTNTNLGIFTNDVLSGMEKGGQVDVIYTDFEKAFDRVDHIILLRKLYELGIRGNLLRWMDSYLRNRCQAVVVGGYRSDFILIPSGVPQGSILGPLLYLVYLYDIASSIRFSKFLMYADDTKIYCRIKDITDCEKLQGDLDRLHGYYIENRICINATKCAHVTFTRKRNPIKFDYHFNNVKVDRVDVVRDLGVTLDSKMTYSEHVEAIVNKAYKNLGFVLRVSRPFSDITCLKILYFAYVRSILEYCSTIWNPHCFTYKHTIERIQAKFLKHLNYRSFHVNNDYELNCKYHRLLSLENRRVLLDMLFLHGICNGSIDSNDLASSILQFRVPMKRTRHTTLFSEASTHTNYAQNSVVCRLQRTFNERFGSLDIFFLSKPSLKKSIIDILV